MSIDEKALSIALSGCGNGSRPIIERAIRRYEAAKDPDQPVSIELCKHCGKGGKYTCDCLSAQQPVEQTFDQWFADYIQDQYAEAGARSWAAEGWRGALATKQPVECLHTWPGKRIGTTCADCFQKHVVHGDPLRKIEAEMHYPECWDTMTYPTIFDAIYEMAACSEHPAKREILDAPAINHAFDLALAHMPNDGHRQYVEKVYRDIVVPFLSGQKPTKRESGALVGLMQAVRNIIEDEKCGMDDMGEAAQLLLALCDDIDIALSQIEGQS